MDELVPFDDRCVVGTLSGFDRVRLRGTVSLLMSVGGLLAFLSQVSVLLKDFGSYAEQVTTRLRKSLEQRTLELGRKVRYLPGFTDKEELVAKIRREEGVGREGLIAVLSTLENCQSFDIYRNAQTHQLELQRKPRKCLHYYVYFDDATFGQCHVRIQTWFPFDVRIMLNGREWLGRQMDHAGIGYLRKDNCFTWIGDFAKAQELCDRQRRIDWPRSLGRLLAFASPLQQTLLGVSMPPYYWTSEQTEWATDIAFDSVNSLAQRYPTLVRHGLEHLRCVDAMRFLGQKIPAHGGVHGRFAGEVITDLKTRPEGMCLRHIVNGNKLKMYDKHGQVLRIETTLNNTAGLKVFRRKGDAPPDAPREWLPLRKGVADLSRRAELSHAANQRYLEALKTVSVHTPLSDLTDPLSQPTKDARGRRHRALNLLAPDDARLLNLIAHGDWLLTGFRNRDLRAEWFGHSDDTTELRRQSGAISRKLLLLRAHGLIRRIEGTHRYLLTKLGRQTITALQSTRLAKSTTTHNNSRSQQQNSELTV